MKRLMILLTVLLLGTLTAVAQVDDQGNPNDPTVNDNANACFEGGAMEDKCDTDWEWDCGWYLIRFNYGITPREEFPVRCAILLPPEIMHEFMGDITGVLKFLPAGCYTSSASDGSLEWPGGTDGTATFHGNTTCSSPNGVATYVMASPSDEALALSVCMDKGFDTVGPTFWVSGDPNIDIWLCLDVV